MDVVLQVGVKVLLRNKEGKYLLLHRRQEKYPEVKDLWDIIGGRITPGTPLLGNLKREVKEETGLDLIDEPKLVAAQDILRVQGRHVVRLTYVAGIAGEVVLDPEEHDEYGWFTIEEIKQIEGMDSYFLEIVDKLTF